MRHTKKAVFIVLGVAVLAGGGFFAYGSMQPAITSEGVRMGDLALGGITRDELMQKLEAWWTGQKSTQIEPRSDLLLKQPKGMTLEAAGIRPDWDATLSSVRFNTYFDRTFGRTGEPTEIEIVWKVNELSIIQDLVGFVEQNARKWQPARVAYEAGKIVRHYEVPTFSLDEDRVPEAMIAAVEAGQPQFELPLKKEPAKVPDEMLDEIKEVMADFSTSFNAGQSNRSSNIRLACKALNGSILMPGEELSYNEVVGKRTAANGYKEAPVFKNGLKVLDNGGGVCQVSTTMFNASLMADLEIVTRRNHSRPVAYVAVGRDATVDYSSGIDLVIKNPYDFPIAIIAEVDGGTVTFRVLGKKDASKSISIITTNHSSWGNAMKYVDDPTLPPGKETVVDSGAGGRSCLTWRIVRIDGVEVKRENLGKSHYPGATKIIARNPTPVPTVGPDGMPVINPQQPLEQTNGQNKPGGEPPGGSPGNGAKPGDSNY